MKAPATPMLWVVVVSYASMKVRSLPETARYLVTACSEADALSAFSEEVPALLPRAVAALPLNCRCVKVDK